MDRFGRLDFDLVGFRVGFSTLDLLIDLDDWGVIRFLESELRFVLFISLCTGVLVLIEKMPFRMLL